MSTPRPPLRPGRPDPWAALAGMDAPLRALFAEIAAADDPAGPDLARIGAALVAFSHDHDYLAPRLVADARGLARIRLHVPVRGPRLQIVRRPRGMVSPVHDHGSWVAMAPIAGVETHRRYRASGPGTDARVHEVAVDVLAAHAVLTLMDPDDIHEHGHREGSGEPAWLLVINGDDPSAVTRREWDLARGTCRLLLPGDGGGFLTGDPVPDAPTGRG
ncbi:MAG: hypothetical protein ACKOTZ_07040 [Chloroflexota bacterium]